MCGEERYHVQTSLPCTLVDTEDLRRLSNTIGAMATEKQKLKVRHSTPHLFIYHQISSSSSSSQQQPHTKKKKGKVLGNVGKASKRADLDTYDDELGADFDDFM